MVGEWKFVATPAQIHLTLLCQKTATASPRVGQESLCPLPLRERAARRFGGKEWVRGEAATPRFFPLNRCGCPLPQGERAQQRAPRSTGVLCFPALLTQ